MPPGVGNHPEQETTGVQLVAGAGKRNTEVRGTSVARGLVMIRAVGFRSAAGS
jgi:hypothetical protein